MRLGLALDLGSTTPVADQIEGAGPLLREAEDVGWSGVWVGESYHRSPEPFHLPAALLVLAHLAARTTLRLGTGVLLVRAYDPVLLGYETALLDQLSRGRLDVGVGLGPVDLPTRAGPTERGGAQLMDETLRALTAAWGRDGTATAVPGPVGRGPRLLVGGGTRAGARRAAELGDGYYAATNYSDALLARQSAAYEEEGGIGEVVANRLCLVHPDREQARRLAAEYLAPVLDYYTRRRLWRSVPGDENPGPTALVGSPREITEELHRYAEMGVTALNLRVAPLGTPAEVARRTVALVDATPTST